MGHTTFDLTRRVAVALNALDLIFQELAIDLAFAQTGKRLQASKQQIWATSSLKLSKIIASDVKAKSWKFLGLQPKAP